MSPSPLSATDIQFVCLTEIAEIGTEAKIGAGYLVAISPESGQRASVQFRL